MADEDQVLELLRQQLDRSSAERQAQSLAFERTIAGLRMEIRVLLGITIVLLLLGTLARQGTFAEVAVPGMTVTTRPESP
jgi:hypothetical protein